MAESKGAIATENASRYLQQLCKHWSHRFDVAFTPVIGRVPFGPDSVCVMEAEADVLKLTITAPDAAAVTRLQGVMYTHLQRFAVREELPAPEWS